MVATPPDMAENAVGRGCQSYVAANSSRWRCPCTREKREVFKDKNSLHGAMQFRNHLSISTAYSVLTSIADIQAMVVDLLPTL